MWSLFRNCRKACEYRYELGLTPRQKDPNLSFGSLIHECLQLWHGTRDLAAVLDFIDRACPSRVADEGVRRDWHLARAMMIGYAQRYPQEEFTVVALEKTFEGRIINPETGAASRSFLLAGIQPSTTDQHQMQVPISQGLTGWTWDQNGNRTPVTGLTNPFWIAVNSLLRALGLAGAPSGTQLNQTVLSSLVVGDGSGAAEIADTLVAPVVGSGVEKQFRFQGVLAQQKPFRDWLVEILACGLGFFTWEFGKLKVGCRINASAVDAFTLGNILFQSLRLEPLDASFEHLIIDFADQAYQYQANTAEYQDKSHAAYFGRAGAPLTARQHLVGCATISQALRLAATRTREEIGGVDAAEWRNARAATWKTTLLGLNNEVGQVVSMTHPDVPGMKGTCSVTSGQCGNLAGDPLDKFIVNKEVSINGVQCTVTQIFTTPDYKTVTGFAVSPAPADSTNATFRFITADFRIQSWRLHKDWSVTITAKTVTASMYDLDVGPKPLDVTPAPLPALFYPIPLGPAWAPYQIQARADDALFPGEWTFDTNQSYAQMADGSMLANLVVTGKLPVNTFSPGVGAPVAGGITVNTTGGSLAGGTRSGSRSAHWTPTDCRQCRCPSRSSRCPRADLPARSY